MKPHTHPTEEHDYRDLYYGFAAMSLGAFAGFAAFVWSTVLLNKYIRNNNHLPFFINIVLVGLFNLYSLPENIAKFIKGIHSKLRSIQNKKSLTAIEALIKELNMTERLEELEISLDAEEIPMSLLCPITHLLMTDPVFNVCGITYDRHALVEWYKDKHTDPRSNLRLTKKQKTVMISNKIIEEEILQFIRNKAAEAANPLPQPVPTVTVIEKKSSKKRKTVEEIMREKQIAERERFRNAFLNAFTQRQLRQATNSSVDHQSTGFDIEQGNDLNTRLLF